MEQRWVRPLGVCGGFWGVEICRIKRGMGCEGCAVPSGMVLNVYLQNVEVT